jgi:hypothetical protein
VLSNVQHLSRFDLENREVSDGNRVKTRRESLHEQDNSAEKTTEKSAVKKANKEK